MAARRILWFAFRHCRRAWSTHVDSANLRVHQPLFHAASAAGGGNSQASADTARHRNQQSRVTGRSATALPRVPEMVSMKAPAAAEANHFSAGCVLGVSPHNLVQGRVDGRLTSRTTWLAWRLYGSATNGCITGQEPGNRRNLHHEPENRICLA